MNITLTETRFTTTIGPDGAREVYVLDFTNLLPGAAEPAVIAAYLIQRGLDETLGNAWSTQPADARSHVKVAERLRRIQTDPGAGGRTGGVSETERETMVLLRKRLATAGIKAEILKAASTPDKLRAELVRAVGSAEKAAAIWDRLAVQAAEIVDLRRKAVGTTAGAFDDLL